jgi:hypothetical protein
MYELSKEAEKKLGDLGIWGFDDVTIGRLDDWTIGRFGFLILEFVWNLFGICLEFVWNLFGICLEFGIWNLEFGI